MASSTIKALTRVIQLSDQILKERDPKKKIYLRGRPAPSGHPVYVGPRGGKYILPQNDRNFQEWENQHGSLAHHGKNDMRPEAQRQKPRVTPSYDFMIGGDKPSSHNVDSEDDFVIGDREKGLSLNEAKVALKQVEREYQDQIVKVIRMQDDPNVDEDALQEEISRADAIRDKKDELGIEVKALEEEQRNKRTSVRRKQLSDLKLMSEIGGEHGINAGSTYKAKSNIKWPEKRDGLSDDNVLYKETYSEAPNEIATFQIAQALGLDMYPDVLSSESTRMDYGAHVMRWVDECGTPESTATTAWGLNSNNISPNMMRQFIQMNFMDTLTRNTDRHGGNFMIDRSRDRIWSIDTGYSMSHSSTFYDRDDAEYKLYRDNRQMVNLDVKTAAPIYKDMQERLKKNRKQLVEIAQNVCPEDKLFEHQLDVLLNMDFDNPPSYEQDPWD